MIDWRHWHNEPLLVGGLVFAGWWWALLAGPLRDRLAPGVPFPRRQAWYFYSALVLFYLAVGSPLDQIQVPSDARSLNPMNWLAIPKVDPSQLSSA